MGLVQNQPEKEDVFRQAYYENVIRQLGLNPAVLVLALAVYVLLLFIGFLGNVRVISLIWRRVRRSPLVFDIRLADLDTFSICCTNFFSILCFTFVVFDLVYGQWILPSGSICRSYLAAEGFSRIVSSMTLSHFALICSYFVRRIRTSTGSSSELTISTSASLLTKASAHYFYIFLFCPALALILSIVLFQHADVHYLQTDVRIPTLNVTETVTTAKCVVRMTDGLFTAVTIYASVCGYLAPVAAYVSAGILCQCRFQDIASDPCVRRYANLAKRYCVLFLLCHTGEWSVSIYDYFVGFSMKSNRETYQQSTAFILYFTHILRYLTCVGYPVLYLLCMSVNRIGSDLSADSLALGREEIAMSMSSTQQFVARDQSRDLLLSSTRRPIRSRTMSNLHIAHFEARVTIGTDRHSYHTLGGDREKEDAF